MKTDLVPTNGNRFGTKKCNRFSAHKWEPNWYQKMGTDLVHQNGNRFGNQKLELTWCPQTVFYINIIQI